MEVLRVAMVLPGAGHEGASLLCFPAGFQLCSNCPALFSTTPLPISCPCASCRFQHVPAITWQCCSCLVYRLNNGSSSSSLPLPLPPSLSIHPSLPPSLSPSLRLRCWTSG
eukprot:1880722-Rhodomonas_salina.1